MDSSDLWHVHTARDWEQDWEQDWDQERWITIYYAGLFTHTPRPGVEMGPGKLAMGFLPEIFQYLKYFPVVHCNGFQLYA